MELIFEVRDAEEGGFWARALGHAIFTQGETWDELRANLLDATASHFDGAMDKPGKIQLHYTKQQLVALAYMTSLRPDAPHETGTRNKKALAKAGGMVDQAVGARCAYARRCFRDVADADYICARMAFRFEFYVQYIWSSQQAIEKYLKAILLYNAQRPPLTHSLEGLLKRVRAVKSIQFSITPKSEAFVEDISGLNPVKIRYLSNGFHVEMTDLALLDQAIWELRMYCELLDYSTRDAGKVTSRLEADVQRIENGKIGSKACPLLGGELERIFASTTEVRDHLVWNNKYFGGETLDVDGFTSTWSVLEDQAMASLLKDFIPFKDFLPTAEVGPELIFEVTGSDAGGFKARALGPNISVKASDWKDLQTEVVQTAIAQLGPNAPRLLRLIYVKDEFIAASPST